MYSGAEFHRREGNVLLVARARSIYLVRWRSVETRNVWHQHTGYSPDVSTAVKMLDNSLRKLSETPVRDTSRHSVEALGNTTTG